ncbi:MAG: hypothetical protein JNK84_02900 [Phreatobacter sp.]|uniref:hypothetical protein n=1 Tax=Phreatobacter sp. TaxID=1966341 RepID=UPI001A3F65F6|nr:hypothetical protein [Phreatobacter sp.]MBL8568011.1 hypothetical protein [Phreatobacter sp.]
MPRSAPTGTASAEIAFGAKGSYAAVDVTDAAALAAFLLDGGQSACITGLAIAADGGFAEAGLTKLDG